jgi:hypothetical protein
MGKGTVKARKNQNKQSRQKPTSGSGASRKGSGTMLQAILRAQQMNDMLKKSIIESEALQSSGDDRPSGEDHISNLLEEDSGNERAVGSIERYMAKSRSKHISRSRRGPSRKSRTRR